MYPVAEDDGFLSDQKRTKMRIHEMGSKSYVYAVNEHNSPANVFRWRKREYMRWWWR
jgi:hypothetical protein